MLPDELEKRLDGIEDASKKGYPVRNLYKIACEPGLWLQAYVNIRANAGALTQGVSTDTIDGFSIERAEKLAKTLRSREYVAKPVRRVQIPKKDGKTRPLGIPGGDDKLAQEVARIILEGTVAKLAMRQPFVLFKGLTFQKLCLPGAFRPGDHHNKMLRPGLCVVHASPQYL
uniref:Group II intron-encoded protein LtrA n=1 Tax=Escherichia coli TaxID=562 RepID=A0A109PIS9_ECOLX|nr:Group II intron-encoded protein LtrA [Escherichia coli]